MAEQEATFRPNNDQSIPLKVQQEAIFKLNNGQTIRLNVRGNHISLSVTPGARMIFVPGINAHSMQVYSLSHSEFLRTTVDETRTDNPE